MNYDEKRLLSKLKSIIYANEDMSSGEINNVLDKLKRFFDEQEF